MNKEELVKELELIEKLLLIKEQDEHYLFYLLGKRTAIRQMLYDEESLYK